MGPRRRIRVALVSALAAASLGAVFAFAAPSAVRRLDLVFYDQAMRLTAEPSEASQDIVLVHVDEETIAWAQRELRESFPWPLEFYAVLVETLRGFGARVVALDFLLENLRQDEWGDLVRVPKWMGDAGGVVLGASLTSGTRGRPRSAGFGALLLQVEGRAEAEYLALLVEALKYEAWLEPGPEGFTVWAGGFSPEAGFGQTEAEAREAAAEALSVARAALRMVASDLVPDLEEALDSVAFEKILRERLRPRIARVPASAERFGAEQVLARRFALAPAAAATFPVTQAQVALLPHAPLLQHIAGLGSVDQAPDGDGVMRRFRPVVAYEGRLYPSFPLAAWLAGSEGQGLGLGAEGLTVGGHRIPLDGEGTAWIRFHGDRPYDANVLSAYEVLQDAARLQNGESPRLDPARFAGKLVVLSPTALGLRDFKPSPLSRHHLGADLNAAMLDGLLTGRWVRPAPRWVQALAGLISALFGALILAFTRGLASGLAGSRPRLRLLVRAGVSGAVVVLIAGLVIAIPFLLFSGLSYWAGMALPLATALTAILASSGAAEALERRERRLIHDALGIYTSRMVADLVATGGVSALDPRRDDVSVFFSDIAGFTSFSEKMSPEALAELLNEYLTEMTDVVLGHEGIVDKYIGDAIMAFWGWRGTQPDHALRSVRCAMAMRARLHEIAPGLESRYGVKLVVRAGINSGVAVVGNMGSAHKMNVTLMGDVVNLASRLEGANKAYGTELMIGEGTFERLEGRIAVRELDLLRVKGKDRPVRVFEPLVEAAALDDALGGWVEVWEGALTLYRDARFLDARAAFERALSLRPQDEPTQLYLERCEAFLIEPPPEDWDGVYVMKSK